MMKIARYNIIEYYLLQIFWNARKQFSFIQAENRTFYGI